MFCKCLTIREYRRYYFVLKVNIFFLFKRERKGSGNSKLEAFIFLQYIHFCSQNHTAFLCKEPSWPDVGLAAVHCYAGLFTGKQTPYTSMNHFLVSQQ